MPPYPGEFLNPFPLGATIPLSDGGDALTVNSATIDATAEVEAVINPNTGQPANGPPPAGDQYTLVNLTLTLGMEPLVVFLGETTAEGSASYTPDSCVPPSPDLGTQGNGLTLSGNLCFTIASSDASTLLLRTYDQPPKGPPFPVWFALR